MGDNDVDNLKTLNEDGTPPSTRMKDAAATQDVVRRLINNDERRAYKRARVNGLVDGNPPYKLSKLREAGRGESCNVNFGTARSYLESGSGSFYDLTSEAPSAVTFRTAHGTTDEEKERWSNIASQEANVVFAKEYLWDYQMQISQWDMVLHGCGPLFFEDAYKVFPRAVLCGDLKVPERTKSETDYWEMAAINVDYYPPQLYEFIQNEKAAATAGWDVEYTKRVIEKAMNIQAQQGAIYDWEYYQQQIKNNSFTYYDDAKISQTAHVFWKEFDGRITHAIIERNSATGLPVQYLFIHVGRYANWKEAVHPMYFDHGNGGFHHSVTGLGVKMYSAMEYENRLICNGCDKAFAPKVLFKPTTTESSQKFSLVHLGDYAVMPPNFDMQQQAIASGAGDVLEMRNEITGLMRNNLSNYRTGAEPQKQGNPATKFQKQMEAAMQAALSMPQYNRYYCQMDQVVAEIWRRLTNLNSTDDRAIQFQKRCKAQGVPVEALARVQYVGATRVVGQGSAFMRKQAIDALFPIAGSLPEEGRVNLICDKIAAEAGQTSVMRYYPKKAPNDNLATDQQVEALHWVGDMKQGIPFIITSTQNAVTYAGTFLTAATHALQSLQQGADPHGVLAFLQMAGPAIAACLKRFGQDPTRQAVHQQMAQQWQQLAKITDQLKKKMQQNAQQQQAQQQKTQAAMTDQQIAQAKAKNDIALKTAKTRAQMQQSAEKHRLQMAKSVQGMQLADASTAANIHRENLRAFQTTE